MVDKEPESEERTEDDKVVQEGLKVILGGKECKIAPLVIRDSRKWRKEVGPWKAELSQYASVDSDNDPEGFKKALTSLMVERIDETIEFFFKYAKDLNKEEIEGIATDNEVVAAFNKVFEYAFPFG